MYLSRVQPENRTAETNNVSVSVLTIAGVLAGRVSLELGSAILTQLSDVGMSDPSDIGNS